MSNSLVYFHTFKANVKERWKNKPLIDVLSYEFQTRPREYFIEAILNGVVTVNDKIVSLNYRLKLVDYIKHTIHIHEPKVPDIEIIKKEDEYIVVNKPSGVPCHPTGAYIQYSITKKLFGDMKVACVNRLDMPVSGILIITYKNLKNSMMKINDTEKIYIAKVNGKFPNSIECDYKIFCQEGRRRFVDEKGKDCLTKFKLIKFNSKYSLVECRPITGRTHQIRIHLQALGFPIINDLIYGDYEIENKEYISNCTEKWDKEEEKNKMNCVLKYCKGENNRSFDVQKKFICLHAWKYKFNEIWYESRLPEWTNID